MRQFTRCFLLLLVLFTTGVLSAQLAPDFTITDSDGIQRSLYADYLNQGKTVLIEVFFTTCPPCNAFAPYMEPLYQDWGGGDNDVEFFDLSDKNFDTNALVNSYKTNQGHTYVAAGSEGGSLAAVAPYKAGMFGPFYGTPTFIVIAPGGTVQYDVHGANSAGTVAALDAAIAATGAQKPTCINTYAINESICAGESVIINGVSYNAPGTYTDTVAGGSCDSLLWITITQSPLAQKTVNASFCAGESVTVYGNTYSSAGSFEVNVPSVTTGCDTVVTINVSMLPINTKVVNATFETGDSVLVYGTWYASPGTYNVLVESTTTACDTILTIHISEEMGVPQFITVEGFVRTFSGVNIAGAYVVANNADDIEIARDTTNTAGQYKFTFDSTYFVNNPISIQVYKSINPVNGVSVLDLVGLQKHLLGLELLNSTEKLFAADVNQSGTISVLDILYLRKLLLGLETGFPNGNTWIFFHQSVDLGAPGLQPPVIEEQDPIMLQNIYAGTQSSVFRGIKIGDLNNSANPQN